MANNSVKVINTMEEFLLTYDTEHLEKLAKEVGVFSAGADKQMMAAVLSNFLRDPENMREGLLRVNEEGLDAFEAAMDKGAFVPSDSELDVLDQVMEENYIFANADGSVQVPADVVSAYKVIKDDGYREYHEKAFWLIQCIHAASYLFVSEPVDVLFTMYCHKDPEGADFEEFESLLDSIPGWISHCYKVGNSMINDEMYSSGAYRKLEASRKKIDFYIPDLREIELLVKDGFPSYEPAYQALMRFFMDKLGYPEKSAEYLCHVAYSTFAAGGLMSELVDTYTDMDVKIASEEDMKELASLLMKSNDDTRMPELCGHKPREIGTDRPAFPFVGGETGLKRPEKKIYPNDLCPCGSGKKYKKCCGR